MIGKGQGFSADAEALTAPAGSDAPAQDVASETQDARTDALAVHALLIARTYMYTLFHKALGGEPASELIAHLTSDVTLNVTDEYAQDETMRGLQAFLCTLGETDRDQTVDAARDEYTRTFVGPAMLPALPLESPYVTHDAAVFQENTLAVREQYRAHGLLPKRCLKLPDDHVALMCDFMARLADDALASFEAADADAFARQLVEQQAFVAGHMTTWLFEYARGLRRSKTAVLYPQLVEALAAFVKLDADFAVNALEWLGDEVRQLGADADEPEAFFRAKEAREQIRSLRLFGLEDNELAPIDRVSGHNFVTHAPAATACA